MSQIPYPDIAVTEGDAFVTYSKEGFKVKRVFKVSSLDNSNPTSTLYTAITNGSLNPGSPLVDIPIRMTPHPTIVIESEWAEYYASSDIIAANNCFMADVISIKQISSTQAVVEVEY